MVIHNGEMADQEITRLALHPECLLPTSLIPVKDSSINIRNAVVNGVAPEQPGRTPEPFRWVKETLSG